MDISWPHDPFWFAKFDGVQFGRQPKRDRRIGNAGRCTSMHVPKGGGPPLVSSQAYYVSQARTKSPCGCIINNLKKSQLATRFPELYNGIPEREHLHKLSLSSSYWHVLLHVTLSTLVEGCTCLNTTYAQRWISGICPGSLSRWLHNVHVRPPAYML